MQDYPVLSGQQDFCDFLATSLAGETLQCKTTQSHLCHGATIIVMRESLGVDPLSYHCNSHSPIQLAQPLATSSQFEYQGWIIVPTLKFLFTHNPIQLAQLVTRYSVHYVPPHTNKLEQFLVLHKCQTKQGTRWPWRSTRQGWA